jgi:hypothetical protein
VHIVGFIIRKFVTMHGHMNVKFDDLYFVNISSENKVAQFCSVDLLCLLSCIIGTIQVTEDYMLATHGLYYHSTLHSLRNHYVF